MNIKFPGNIVYLSFLFLFAGCDGTICKMDEQDVIISYDAILKIVRVGGESYVKNKGSPWVKRVIVKPEGFLVVHEYKTAGFHKEPCEDDPSQTCEKHRITKHYIMQRYTEEDGYKYWFRIPKEEWEPVSDLETLPSIEPYHQTQDCKYSFFVPLLHDIIAILRAW